VTDEPPASQFYTGLVSELYEQEMQHTSLPRSDEQDGNS
jgi:hypothetical protein